MQAGRLSDRVIFQKPVVTNPGGYRTVTWEDDFVVPAEVQIQAETLARFVIRYRTTGDENGNEVQISAKTHRIVWEGKIFHITSAPHDRKRTQLTIDADFSMMVDSTDLQSEHEEFITGLPVIRPREDT